jgi:hypothetical protein
VKPLFLRSCLINLLATTILTATLVLTQSETQGLSIIAKLMVGAIALVYAVATIYAAIICWRIDSGRLFADMAHAANNISFAAGQCPYIGLLGSVTGIFYFMHAGLSTSSDPEHIKEVISSSMTGIGIAFVPTIAGIFALLVLNWQHHIITQTLEEPKPVLSIFEPKAKISRNHV